MDVRRTISRGTLPALALVYTLASLGHFLHNGAYLNEYPNMPPWISAAEVYGTWCAIAALGFVALLLLAKGFQRSGLLLLILYAALGFDSLAHYALAPMAAHSFGMNLTIVLEAATAALLFAASLNRLVRRW